jgi:uncharacterized protein YdhG (YjbR/CyaY superfamily)
MKDTKITTVDAYIKAVPAKYRKAFEELHHLVIDNIPDGESCMSYGMPAVKLHGIVVYYAYWEKHMAIYPMPSALKQFAAELDGYVTSKSTIQFQHDKPLPKKLIKEIVKFRLKENNEKAALKKAAKKK